MTGNGSFTSTGPIRSQGECTDSPRSSDGDHAGRRSQLFVEGSPYEQPRTGPLSLSAVSRLTLSVRSPIATRARAAVWSLIAGSVGRRPVVAHGAGDGIAVDRVERGEDPPNGRRVEAPALDHFPPIALRNTMTSAQNPGITGVSHHPRDPELAIATTRRPVLTCQHGGRIEEDRARLRGRQTGVPARLSRISAGQEGNDFGFESRWGHVRTPHVSAASARGSRDAVGIVSSILSAVSATAASMPAGRVTSIVASSGPVCRLTLS